MIAALIRWSLENRFLVVVLTGLLIVGGVWALRTTPVDALPDLSDVQVIVRTSYPGQAPQVIEDQITYPLATAMLSVPGARTVRGYSMFGDSYVYILFEDGTDLYWARSRVLEYLSRVAPRLPAGVNPALGPDATGVGWVYQYALVDRTGNHDLSQLRSIQDWFLKYELQTVPGVAEVATIGGMVKQYQVVVDPQRLRAFNLPLSTVTSAIKKANQETGGSVVEIAEAEYMVRASGYIDEVADLEAVPLRASAGGTPVLLSDVAQIRLGPELRRGLGELDGEGEAVGGVIIMRWGENALTTIEAVKERLDTLRQGLPKGVEIVPTYDRSGLIERAIDNLTHKLVEEMIVVVLVCAVFLLHLRSSLVVVLFLPLGILAAFIVMRLQGINANIMSLGGIAIAIGAMVDAAIVMIENLHRKIETTPLTRENRWAVVAEATQEVGPALFFSLLIITVSFVPVFALEAQEGRMFKPLAFTKTYAMGAASILSVTLVPVLMGWFIRGKHIIAESRNPVSRFFIWLYRPLLTGVSRHPLVMVVLAGALTAGSVYPLSKLGSEFMPELDEGDLLYMPSLFPAVSVGKAGEILQQTDRLIRTLPEVESVYGKVGRAETATDPAPLTMVETTIRLKPRDQWRPGMTMAGIRAELDRIVQVPGVTNVWIMPIKNRLDMLATGVKTPVGIKVSGPDLVEIGRLAAAIEGAIKGVPGTTSAYAERTVGGRYLQVDINRLAAARHGLSIAEVQDVIRSAIGGIEVSETIEGLERYPINVRYPYDDRSSPEAIRDLPMVTPSGAHITLGDVASIRVEDGPGMIRSENARLNGWVYVDIAGRDLGGYVAEARQVVRDAVPLPPGYSVAWSGQFEFLERAQERLGMIVPVVVLLIIVLLYMAFRRALDVVTIVGTLPVALSGGVWLLWLLDFDLSVAVVVGFIALAGVAVETAILMQVYLNIALDKRRAVARAEGRPVTMEDVQAAVTEGALLRLRPKLMTVATIFAGLLPIMHGAGTGSDVMRRIAAPMVGGMATATVLTLFVIPAVFILVNKIRGIRDPRAPSTASSSPAP
ncbi:efflux RND transporter permease subunit [Pararhodospirillum oryzae]|uniref:Cation transporter n=1 Tax=Pararhodospirillum oryzae TaxID=478448 RepID=A0A512H7M0_9PROT|nr:CusA/CzcA family heavy metal efflux RND transporter [Pararhodospirillum oryzae]GEO81453.1 cation transporter [Pararhodospirillum oryzae]